MRKKQLLFVTYHDENFEEGLSYAVDLAKTMNDGISILMIYKRTVMEKFGDLMTVVTFAEAGEHKTAREMISEDYKKHNRDYEERLAQLVEKCREADINVEVSTAAMDIVSAIRNFIRQNTGIDMVLLSPSITNDSNITTKELNRLVKTASRPVVTMAKNSAA
ncbi:MAG: hypothetical protein AB1553_10465 [Nitrospirota bacterium]